MIEADHLPSPPDLIRIRRALLSVYDKTGLVELARDLTAAGVSLVSSGGTARILRAAGLAVEDVSEVTGSPEILGGRVKTFHPRIHGGLLARRGYADDEADLEAESIVPFDLVVVNLYPFEDTVRRPDVTDAEAMENIDIGGPAMVRAAAKNHAYVAVVSSPDTYDTIRRELAANDFHLSLSTRRHLACLAFNCTAAYDRAVADYLAPAVEAPPKTFAVHLPRVLVLRYGENPHQRAAAYGGLETHFEKLHGKALSFNNLIDLGAALALIDEFPASEPAVAILKHTNPCGVAVAKSQEKAYLRALATDRKSPFGGIVVVNSALSLSTAEAIDKIFTEIVIAPEFDNGVIDFLTRKKNRRIVQRLHPTNRAQAFDVRSIPGGLLIQDWDTPSEEDFRVVTARQPTDGEMRDLEFAWRVVKHVKSNAIVYAKDGATLGVGAGQMSRIDASELAVHKGESAGLDFAGSVIASDAFFPFADGLLAAADCGARAAIQPGGSIRDNEVTKAADDRHMAMVFTGRRHFRH